jgi:hypothetical protein
MLSNHKQESEDSRNKNRQKTQQTSKKESSKKKGGEKSSSSPIIKASSSSRTVEADVDVAHVEPKGSTKQNATANLTLADVMSFLKDMENDQNKTENKLNDLADKVSEMYDEYENYDENQLLYGDDANDDQNNRVDNSVDNTVQIDDNNNDSQHPAKRRKTVDGQSETQNHEKIDNPDSDSAKKSNFKDLVEKFKVKEKVDSPVDSDLAELVNSMFQNGLQDHQLSELVNNINRPENCSMLTKTRVNQLIWDLLSDYPSSEENTIQYRQGLLIKTAILITKLVNKLNECKNNETLDVPIKELMDLGTDALGILGHCNRTTNLSRRDLHKPDLSYDYYHLGSSTVPYTEYLYGNDISKKVSDIDSVNKVGRKVMRGRGSGRFLRRRGGRFE